MKELQVTQRKRWELVVPGQKCSLADLHPALVQIPLEARFIEAKYDPHENETTLVFIMDV